MRMLARLRVAASLFLAVAAGAPAFAQYQQKTYYASDYGQWQIPSQAANTYLFSPSSLCSISAPGVTGTILPFNTNAPVFIVDSTAANSELVTPSSVTNNGSSCGVSVAPANNHYSFKLISGTGGLQEVLNQIPSSAPYVANVFLDRSWYALMTSVTGSTAAGVINTVAGNAQATIIDNTTVPWSYYAWNGTNYTPAAANGTAPSFTSAGTGAGSGASGAIVAGSTGTVGYVTITTGTTPAASGIIFTLTWPAIASGGFQYAPSCAVTSVGTTHTYTSGTVTSTAGAPATMVLTASTTAMTASVSGYKFKYVCH